MVDLLYLFGSIFLVAAVITRLVLCKERRVCYADPEPDPRDWKDKP